MGRVSTGTGTTIGFHEVGRGCGKLPILFLHGVGSDKSVWRPQLEYFGRTRRAVAFDYPGYGESDPAPEQTTRDDYARAVTGAAATLEIGRAHICGLSLGGVVAIAIGDLQPKLCASLILADTFAAHPDGEGIYRRSVEGSCDMAALAAARIDMLLAQPAVSAVRQEAVATMSRIDPAAYRIGARAVWLADQRERASRLKMPTLIMCGEEDRATPPALSHDLRGRIAGSRLEMISRAGHLANVEQPVRFNALLESFVDSVEAPEPS